MAPGYLQPATSLFCTMCLCLATSVAALWLTLSRLCWDSGQPENMSPESSSSLFPDRPIRPLPKRRLRERLSPDVADSIKYPPTPQTTAPLFVYPYNSKEESTLVGPEPVNVASRENFARLGQEAGLRRNGLGTEHDESFMAQARRAALGPRAFHISPGHAIRASQRPGQARHPNPQAPPSTASSADGYDSFENTNNKKKRKIPTAGETILNRAHVLNNPNVFGVPSPPTTGDEGPGDASGAISTPYYQSGGPTTNGQGISGPGRGRYGRVRNGRSPLRALSDPNSNWGGRNLKLRPGHQYPSPPGGANIVENSGIISSAIASAEKVPVPQGQENISLLHQQASTKSSPASATQFTFTFDSQNPVSWPGSDPAPSGMAGANRISQSTVPADYRDPYAAIGTRAAQTQPGLVPPAGHGGSQQGVTPPGDGGGKGQAPPNSVPKKSKRRGNSLHQAAKQRRKETEYKNLHHPPALEDIWVCEFCDYEKIFGHPPEALIRQYEIKDRRRRREEAERRRLLEKAKMKSRKGKKASKLPAKNANAASDRNSAPSGDHQAPPPPPPPLHDQEEVEEMHSEGFDSEDNYEDNFHDDDIPSLIPTDDYRPHSSTAQAQGGGLTSGAGGGQDGIRA
ncbi:hypothetical protein F5X99DRAFT_331319 [Biscogniauxia marginata]|nr:hypothetical protein F5X99DRAFT_331319 [Biscogniauxia marginata]